MSSEAVGWAFRCSPYRGVPFAVHLAIADSVNDQNADEFWMRQTVLAAKARTTRGSVNAAIATMLDDGFLVLLREGTGGANRYRFLMPPDAAPIYDPRARSDAGPGGVRSDDTRRAPSAQGVSAHVTGGVRSPDTEPKGNPSQPNGSQPPAAGCLPGIDAPRLDDAARSAAFDSLWESWPKDRRTGKGDARKAWARAITRADPTVILHGAARYIDETSTWPAGDRRYIKTPGPWLNGDRWCDEPDANRRDTPGRTRRATSLPHAPSAPAGRINPEDL